jgi:hypothetical protein
MGKLSGGIAAQHAPAKLWTRGGKEKPGKAGLHECNEASSVSDLEVGGQGVFQSSETKLHQQNLT